MAAHLVNDPYIIRKRCREYAARQNPTTATEQQRGAVVGEINKQLKYLGKEAIDPARRLILGWLFGPEDKILAPMSSKELTPQQLYALKMWIGAKPVDGEWAIRAEFTEEVPWVLARAKSYGETALRYNPPLTMGEMERYYVSEKMKEIAQRAIDIEPGGIVATGISLGGPVVTELPEDVQPAGEPVYVDPVETPKPGRMSDTLINAPEQVSSVFCGVAEI